MKDKSVLGNENEDYLGKNICCVANCRSDILQKRDLGNEIGKLNSFAKIK